MPCRSDYMEPTHNERKQLSVWKETVKKAADELEYTLDLMREYLISGTNKDKILVRINEDWLDKTNRLDESRKEIYAMIRPDFKYLTEFNKMVAEYIILNSFITKRRKMTPKAFVKIQEAQTKHRQKDLDRLLVTFAEQRDFDRLRAVMEADPSKPLESQLGFDPDAF